MGVWGENLVWDRMCAPMCSSCVCLCREQLFVKVEIRSIRGPDGIQLREIKWWWIAVGQQRPASRSAGFCVHIRSQTHIREDSGRKRFGGDSAEGERKKVNRVREKKGTQKHGSFKRDLAVGKKNAIRCCWVTNFSKRQQIISRVPVGNDKRTADKKNG